jgi:hypothetical protein
MLQKPQRSHEPRVVYQARQKISCDFADNYSNLKPQAALLPETNEKAPHKAGLKLIP